MGIFPVKFPTTTADGFESFPLLHYLAFIKGKIPQKPDCESDTLPIEYYVCFELYKKNIVFFKPKLFNG